MQLPIIITDIIIRQDEQGRFCLNDLHKSSGGEKRHQPSNWLVLQQTIELIEYFTQKTIQWVVEQHLMPLIKSNYLNYLLPFNLQAHKLSLNNSEKEFYYYLLHIPANNYAFY